MQITPRQIEIFRWLLISGSATATAKALNTSQPTISRELKALEDQLRFKLFKRDKGRLLPTEEALELGEVVENSYVGFKHIVRAAEGIKNHGLEHIRVACLPAYAHALIPVVSRYMIEAMPNVRISVHSAEEQTLQQEFFTKRYNIVLVETSHMLGDGNVDILDVGNLVVVLPSGHPLCERQEIYPEDFNGVDFINFNFEDIYREKLDKVLTEKGVTPRSQIETITAVGVCAMVQAGLGVSLINPLTAMAYHGQGVEVRRFSPAIPYRIEAKKLQHSLSSELTELFLCQVKAYLEVFQDQLRANDLL